MMDLHLRIHIVTMDLDNHPLFIEGFERTFQNLIPDKIYLFLIKEKLYPLNSTKLGAFFETLKIKDCFRNTCFSVIPCFPDSVDFYLEKIIEIIRIESNQGNDVYMNAWGIPITPIYATWINQMFNIPIYIGDLCSTATNTPYLIHLPHCEKRLPNIVNIFLLRMIRIYLDITGKKSMAKGKLLDCLIYCSLTENTLKNFSFDNQTLRILTSFTEKTTKQYNRLKFYLDQMKGFQFLSINTEKHGMIQLTEKGLESERLFGQYYNIQTEVLRTIINGTQLHEFDPSPKNKKQQQRFNL